MIVCGSLISGECPNKVMFWALWGNSHKVGVPENAEKNDVQ